MMVCLAIELRDTVPNRLCDEEAEEAEWDFKDDDDDCCFNDSVMLLLAVDECDAVAVPVEGVVEYRLRLCKEELMRGRRSNDVNDCIEERGGCISGRLCLAFSIEV